MLRIFSSRRVAAWLAVIAVAFASLAPAISQAMSAKRGFDEGLVQVCTHAGLKWVDVATGEVRDAPGDAGMSGHLERCPFCQAQPPIFPLGAAGASMLVPPLREELPYLFTHAPRTLFVWTHAPSRAPPARA